MTALPYQLDADTGAKTSLGLIVLQVDETIEREFRTLFPGDDPAIHVSRIPSGRDLTPGSIRKMETDLPQAASLLPQAPDYDVVGYACTSGTTLIGVERVADLVRSGCRARSVTDPLTAAIAAFRALDLRSIGLVSPYVASIVEPVKLAFQAAGITVRASVSFGEQSEANVARISQDSIQAAAQEVARSSQVDAVFLSCTNLRTLGMIEMLESEFDRPVLSSNLALGWAMGATHGRGRLFRQGRG